MLKLHWPACWTVVWWPGQTNKRLPCPSCPSETTVSRGSGTGQDGQTAPDKRQHRSINTSLFTNNHINPCDPYSEVFLLRFPADRVWVYVGGTISCLCLQPRRLMFLYFNSVFSKQLQLLVLTARSANNWQQMERKYRRNNLNVSISDDQSSS